MSSLSHPVLPIGYSQCLCTESQRYVFVFHVQLFYILLFTFKYNIYDFKNSPVLSMLRICNVGKECHVICSHITLKSVHIFMKLEYLFLPFLLPD
jgi:hypothetical protein